MNVLPLPGTLSAHIFPPCFSTNSLHRKRPSPVPFSFSVPRVDRSASILKSFSIIFAVSPIPVSDTAISRWLFLTRVLTSTFPFLCVNFIPFEIRFLRIVLIIFLSATIVKLSVMELLSCIFFPFAISFKVANSSLRSSFRLRGIGLNKIFPVCEFAHSSRFSSSFRVWTAEVLISPADSSISAGWPDKIFSLRISLNPIMVLKGFFKSWAIIEKNLSLEALSSCNSLFIFKSASFWDNNSWLCFSICACLSSRVVFFSFNSVVFLSTKFSSRVFWFFNRLTRKRKIETKIKMITETAISLNHNVFHHGGIMIICKEAPFLFHTLSLFEAITLNVYSPGSRLV